MPTRMDPMRRLCVIAVLACLAALAVPPPAPAAVPVLVIDGRGFGHGVGMAQDGALWMGRAGASTNQILGHFYPGTGLGRASGSVRVAVFTAANREAVLSFPEGGELRDGRGGEQAPGFPVRVGPGGQVRVTFDGARYAVRGGQPTAAAPAANPASGDAAAAQTPATTTTSTTQPVIGFPTTSTSTPDQTATTAPPEEPPPPSAPSGGAVATTGRPVWAVPPDGGSVGVPARGRRYRGAVEATGGGGALRLVNEVDVEVYLRGMGEVRDPSWPAASLRAQAIAARTYALRAMAVAGELCDTQRCQVYLGADAEYAAMNKAVADSGRQVIVFGRGLASAVYSANGGGFSASNEEGFGTSSAGYPYLRAAPYETKNPLPWTVKVAFTDLAARFGYPGQLSGARISRTGPSGRALEVTLEGTAGPRTVSGLSFDASLGLKSTLFTLQAGTADVAPPPPPPGEGPQALPDDLAGAVSGPAALPDFAGLAGRPRSASPTPTGTSGALAFLGASLNLAAAALTGRWVWQTRSRVRSG